MCLCTQMVLAFIGEAVSPWEGAVLSPSLVSYVWGQEQAFRALGRT